MQEEEDRGRTSKKEEKTKKESKGWIIRERERNGRVTSSEKDESGTIKEERNKGYKEGSTDKLCSAVPSFHGVLLLVFTLQELM